MAKRWGKTGHAQLDGTFARAGRDPGFSLLRVFEEQASRPHDRRDEDHAATPHETHHVDSN
jgi:hypothetical protein